MSIINLYLYLFVFLVIAANEHSRKRTGNCHYPNQSDREITVRDYTLIIN